MVRGDGAGSCRHNGSSLPRRGHLVSPNGAVTSQPRAERSAALGWTAKRKSALKGRPINRYESSSLDGRNKKRVRLPRPVRHERGEGRGEGCFTMASGPTLRSASSPRPSPPFRTKERETEAPERTARNFAQTDTGGAARENRPPLQGFGPSPTQTQGDALGWNGAAPLGLNTYLWEEKKTAVGVRIARAVTHFDFRHGFFVASPFQPTFPR